MYAMTISFKKPKYIIINNPADLNLAHWQSDKVMSQLRKKCSFLKSQGVQTAHVQLWLCYQHREPQALAAVAKKLACTLDIKTTEVQSVYLLWVKMK